MYADYAPRMGCFNASINCLKCQIFTPTFFDALEAL